MMDSSAFQIQKTPSSGGMSSSTSIWTTTEVATIWDTSLAHLNIQPRLQKSILSSTMEDSEPTNNKTVSASQSHTITQSHGTQLGRSTRSSSDSKPSGKEVNTHMVPPKDMTIQLILTSRKDLTDSLCHPDKRSSTTQNSRKSFQPTLMPLVSTKSQRLSNGLDISKDKL